MNKSGAKVESERQHKTRWVAGMTVWVFAVVAGLRIGFDGSKGEAVSGAEISADAGKRDAGESMDGAV